MALFPTTPTRSSKTTTTAILMSPDNQLTPTCGTNNSCLRRSSRIGKSDNEKIHRKGGVRLFQAQAQERELRSIGNATLPKKQGSSNTTSTSSSTGPGTTRSTAKRSRRARVTTSSTVATATAVAAPSTPNNNNRGTTCTDAVVRPVPVTPELLRGNGTNDDDDDDDDDDEDTKTKTKMKATTKTKAKRKVKSNTTATVKAKASSSSTAKAKTTTTTKTIAKKKKTNTFTAKTKTTALTLWPAPDGWLETWELVRELRKDATAPCDDMGAEALIMPPQQQQQQQQQHNTNYVNVDENEYAKIRRFQTLIALMLSSQTKDAMVLKAMQNLRREDDLTYDDDDDNDINDSNASTSAKGLTVASILAMDPAVLNTKIYSVGFRNNKTKYIKQVAQILHDTYDDDVPATAAAMIQDLPGVGPKMAYIVENICWNRQTGIGVDTHMQRLFPKIGWVSPETKNPEQTRRQLESWLPHEYWGDVNLLWVGFGQEVQQERQKSLRKALYCHQPLAALMLLHTVEFDLVKEWKKLQQQSLAVVEDDDNGINGDGSNEKTAKLNCPWKNDSEREKMDQWIKQITTNHVVFNSIQK